jgi:hypothetical protein
MLRDQFRDPSSNTFDIQKPKKVRRRRQSSCHNSPGLERTSVEPSPKKVISKKTNVRTSREGSEDRESDEEKRVKITPRKHMYPCTESEPDTSELIKDNDKRKIFARGKSLRKKLESIASYSSMKQKGHCLAMELFKINDFESKKVTILFNSLAPNTFLNYQFGWEIFAEYIMDQELWFDFTKENAQEIYNNYLVWLQDLKRDNDIIDDLQKKIIIIIIIIITNQNI